MDFEKLGLFYLGKRYDPQTGTVLNDPILYDSRDLVTHAVCVGMTGSGKTGLCLDLVEEAAIDGVPVIAIDPKGDLGNLLLTFPGLSPEEFAPWIDEDEARRAGQTRETYAAGEARRWKEGLAAWGQDGDRIGRLRKSADFRIYTPGSSAGEPVSILSSFAAPSSNARQDVDLLVERAAGTATAVLSLAGLDAEPRSREHTFLTTLFTRAWASGRDLDLAALIHHIQSPSIEKVGVVDLESFYPATERFDLAMRLNGLLAAPGFQRWLEGASMDPSTLLYTAEGRPRIAIFSIAHLDDEQRMFFVALLLNQIVAWMRRQTGTASLRAIVYMDEIGGYFPPIANPPSKAPLLTILKQGRAFGIGALLATQNPVDLDYKGLGNTGTWLLGRLQTDRDKQRVLDGLESAAVGGINRTDADRMLSCLAKRVFLLHDVHESRPVLFHTRWTMSYLRGPLSRDQIRVLRAQGSGDQGSSIQAAEVRREPGPAAPGVRERPVVPPGIRQFFVPAVVANPHYRPVILAAARVGFTDAKHRVSEQRDVLYAASISDGAIAVDWAAAERLGVSAAELVHEPLDGATFADVPSVAMVPKNYGGWESSFHRFVAQAEQIELFYDKELALTSRAGESERDFRIRVQTGHREARDHAVESLRKKYASRQAQMTERLRRARAAVERETEQASQARFQTAVSLGATVLGAFLGRRAVGAGSLGRATTTARGMGRTMKEADDIKRAAANVEAIRERERALEEEIQGEIAAITDRFASERQFERFALRPRRGQVAVKFVVLGWMV